MSEHYNIHHREYSEYLTMPPLRRLRNDMHLCTDDVMATMSLLRYIKDEFGDPEWDEAQRDAHAERLLVSLRDSGLLPDNEAYAENASDAADQYQIGFFKSFVPLEGSLRDSVEFEDWLPDAFEFVLPTQGKHDPEICVAHGVLFDETCYAGKYCPAKAVANVIQLALTNPDFSSYDYEVDRDKAFRTRVLLLGQLANRAMVSPYQERQLENGFEAKFLAAFPVS